MIISLLCFSRFLIYFIISLVNFSHAHNYLSVFFFCRWNFRFLRKGNIDVWKSYNHIQRGFRNLASLNRKIKSGFRRNLVPRVVFSCLQILAYPFYGTILINYSWRQMTYPSAYRPLLGSRRR